MHVPLGQQASAARPPARLAAPAAAHVSLWLPGVVMKRT